MAKTQQIKIDDIRIDGNTQVRPKIDTDTVNDYAEIYTSEAEMPPVEAVFDGKAHWLWDGFHRWHAARKAGKSTIPCNVTPGTLEDARWLAFSANKKHGMRRDKETVDAAIRGALAQKPETPDGEIAEHVGVHRTTVLRRRKELESTCAMHKSETRTGRDGRTIDVTNIGKSQPPEDDDDAPFDTGEPEITREPVDGYDAGLVAQEDEAHRSGNTEEADDIRRERLERQKREERNGHTGKNGTAKKPKAKEKPKQEQVKDVLGSTVPARMRDVFADQIVPEQAKRIRAWCEAVQFASVGRRIASTHNANPWISGSDIAATLEDAHDLLRAAAERIEFHLPHAICPVCKGSGKESDAVCSGCKFECGWVPKYVYDTLLDNARLEGRSL